MFHIVLLEPEIPANTGNIGRTCLVTGSRLHLIGPMGFMLNDRYLRRAGMDYWKDLDVVCYDSWKDFVWKNAEQVDFSKSTLEDVRYPGIAGTKSGSILPQAERKEAAEGKEPEKARIWMASTKSPYTHDSAAYRDGDYILFGKESAGIPEKILQDHLDRTLRIPMAKGLRSLNLSNSVAIVLYEALRQNRFLQLEKEGIFDGKKID